MGNQMGPTELIAYACPDTWKKSNDPVEHVQDLHA
jgi:hypothetical protein